MVNNVVSWVVNTWHKHARALLQNPPRSAPRTTFTILFVFSSLLRALTPLFPLDAGHSPVSPLFPLDTQKQGVSPSLWYDQSFHFEIPSLPRASFARGCALAPNFEGIFSWLSFPCRFSLLCALRVHCEL